MWAGMTADSGANLAGNMPGVALYDELGNLFGGAYNKGWHIPMGNFRDIEVKGKHKQNQRPMYMRLDAWENDAICIAGIEVTFPDGANVVIFGDAPALTCGWPNYISITDFALGDRVNGYHPHCIWLDGDNSYNHGYPKSIWFHIPDLVGHNETVEAYNKDKRL
jgi:hypothetical protein